MRFLQLSACLGLLLWTTWAAAQQPAVPTPAMTTVPCEVRRQQWQAEAQGMLRQAVEANTLVMALQEREQQLLRERDELAAKVKALETPKEPAQATN